MNYSIRIFFVLILLTVCGCWGPIVLHPVGPHEQSVVTMDSIIRDKFGSIGEFSETLSANFKNDQSDTNNHTYYETMGTSFQVNYHEFTEYFISGLETELSKRGVAVSSNSSNKIHIKLSDFRMSFSTTIGRIYFLIHVSSEGNDWTKTYNGSGTRPTGGNVLISTVVYQNIRTLLEDPAFLAQLEM